jgi:Tfp pilus assembly protein FimT
VDSRIEVKSVRKDSGFSLAELCILLGLIAVTAALSVPLLSSSMRSIQLLSDARSIAGTLSVAKLTAISQMTRTQVSFDISGNQWSLSKWNKTTSQYELQGAVNSLSNGVSNSGIRFKTSSGTAPDGFPTTSSSAITFNSRGIVSNGAVGTVYVSDSDTDFAITVSISGKVQLWRRQNSQWIAQ